MTSPVVCPVAQSEAFQIDSSRFHPREGRRVVDPALVREKLDQQRRVAQEGLNRIKKQKAKTGSGWNATEPPQAMAGITSREISIACWRGAAAGYKTPSDGRYIYGGIWCSGFRQKSP
jgi:hypothetical protein